MGLWGGGSAPALILTATGPLNYSKLDPNKLLFRISQFMPQLASFATSTTARFQVKIVLKSVLSRLHAPYMHCLTTFLYTVSPQVPTYRNASIHILKAINECRAVAI